MMNSDSLTSEFQLQQRSWKNLRHLFLRMVNLDGRDERRDSIPHVEHQQGEE